MEKQNKFFQFKSVQLWKDSILAGFGIFGFISAVMGVCGYSFAVLCDDLVKSVILTVTALLCSYLIAALFLWWSVRKRITVKIRGINVTVCQGDLFEQEGKKVIAVDDAFSISEDDAIISHSSLHGKLIKRFKDNYELNEFKECVERAKADASLGSVIQYKDYILFAMSHLNEDYEAHIINSNYESLMHKMWQGVGRVYSYKPIYLPILGDGITRFDDVSEKPSPSQLLKCMLCSLKTSNVQIKGPITILIYDRINQINLYDVKKFIS